MAIPRVCRFFAKNALQLSVTVSICLWLSHWQNSRALAAEPVPAANGFDLETPLPEVLYSLLDPDGDGTISDEEAEQATAAFQKLARSRHPLAAEIRKALDADGNRKVDADEAAQGLARAKAHLRGVAVEVSEVVKQLDVDGDEQISVAEFRGLLQDLGPLAILAGPKLAEFFNGMDVDRNGSITLVEAQRGADYLKIQLEQSQKEQQMRRKMRDPLFQQAARFIATYDRNRDQQLSEIEARKNKQAAEMVLAADANRDQQLTVDELYEHVKAQRDSAKDAMPPIEFLPRDKSPPKKKR